MKSLYITTLCSLFLLAACNNERPAGGGKQPAKDPKSTDEAVKKLTQNFDFAQPQTIDSSDVVLYPIITTENNGIDEESEYSFKSSSRQVSSYLNIVFYNTGTKKYHLLDKRKMRISDFSVNESNVDSKGAKDLHSKLIFYNVIINDYNNDGKLGNGDPEYLFIFDKEGNNFRQISPNGLDVADWKLLKKQQKVLMTMATDANNNKQFEYGEKSIPYVYDIETGSLAQPVFSPGFTDSVSTLLQQQWAKKKN